MMTRKLLALLLLAGIVLQSCNSGSKTYNGAANNPILYCKTVKELNNVVMGNNFPPIIASRNYVYATIAGYETMVLGDKRFRSLAGQIKHLPPMPAFADTAGVSYEYATLLAFCKVGEAVTFPEGSMHNYVDSLQQQMKAAGMSSDMQKKSEALAAHVAKHIITWSKLDNYPQTRTATKYNVTSEPGRWVPTPPAYTSALEPHWNEIRTMVIDSLSNFMPPEPLVFNVTDKNSAYYKEVMAVKNAGDSLNDEQKHIAEFWDDLGTKMNVSGHVMFVTKKFSPVGHWMNIAGIAAKKANADFGTTVSAYTRTAIAVFDGFIQCWNVKFRYNTVRPETVINKYFDEDWRPFLQTPPFPEYTCGHSTVSASAAEALTEAFGDNFHYTDTSELEFGIKSRSFTSFRQAAEENNWARFYGGIHFHNSCIISTQQGRKVGGYVNNKLQLKKN